MVGVRTWWEMTDNYYCVDDDDDDDGKRSQPCSVSLFVRVKN